MIHRFQRLAPGWPLLGLAFLALWQPSDDGITICPFANITGMACPGCGLSRAFSWMIRGDLTRALTYHPMAPLIALQAGAIWGWWMLRRRGVEIDQRWLDVGLVVTGALLVGVWVLRLASGTLPPV